MNTHASGFTLIELLVVMAVISVLTAIAIPQYHDYKARSYDLQAVSDLRNAAIAQEAYYFDEEVYLDCENAACLSLPGLTRLSDGVRLEMTAAEDFFQAESEHQRGSGRTYTWDSSQGGLMEE